MSSIRPPLPPPLSHEGVSFVLGKESPRLSDGVVSAIALALSHVLPPGDFMATPQGGLALVHTDALSPWTMAGRLESIDRSSR